MITERINKRQQEKEALEAQLAIEQKKDAFCSKEKVIFFLQQLQKGNYENPFIDAAPSVFSFARFTFTMTASPSTYLNGSNEPIAIEDVFLDEVEDYFDSQFSDSAECSLLIADAPPTIQTCFLLKDKRQACSYSITLFWKNYSFCLRAKHPGLLC